MIINKPENYDKLRTSWEPLAPGGHKCIIKQVEGTVSKNGNKMLRISFDTDQDDKQPKFYTNAFLFDKNAGRDAFWRGTTLVVIDPKTDYGDGNLKRFVTAVEDSNPDFITKWGEAFCECFAGAKVGIVFRQEEYTRADGQLGVAVKALRFCNYDTALDQKVPQRKTQDKPQQPQYQQMAFQQALDPALAQEGFMQVSDPLEDEGLPFN